jgi:hypothetical protein
LALGGWALRVALEPELSAFILPGASGVQSQRVSAGLQRMQFSVTDGPRQQRAWLRTSTQQHGWRQIRARPVDCNGPCRGSGPTLLYVRRYGFDMVQEVALVRPGTRGPPYTVSLEFRRCLRLPWVGCWPE